MIRRSWLNFWCALVVLLGSVNAYAQGEDFGILKYALECNEEDFSMCAQPLVQGEPAPFDGQLLSPELAISLSQKALDFDIELTIELQRQQKLFDIELDYQKELRTMEQEGARKQIEVLEKELEEAISVPWYRTPVFVATVSCIATGLVFVGAAYLIKAVD